MLWSNFSVCDYCVSVGVMFGILICFIGVYVICVCCVWMFFRCCVFVLYWNSFDCVVVVGLVVFLFNCVMDWLVSVLLVG